MSRSTTYKLAKAIETGNLEDVKLFLSQCLLPKQSIDFAFRHACNCGRLNIIKYLLNQGADINSFNGNGLYFSMLYGHFHVARYLISQGANTDRINVSKVFK